MKISFVCGLCVKHDAISNSIRDEINWLREFGQHDVLLYAYACDDPNLPFRHVSAPHEVVFDAFFQSSSLVVFHFGVYFELFDVIFATSQGAKRLVIFHNVTPKKFLPPDAHSTIDKSFAQLANIAVADHIGCDSQSNLEVLQRAGIKVPATVLPLAIGDGFCPPDCKPSKADGVIRVAYVGRLVQSKGPLDLISALAENFQIDHSQRWKIDFVANLNFSDTAIVAELRKRIQTIYDAYGARVNLSIIGNADDGHKKRILADADLFVLPTYHEGFCLPILEALASGCRVIAFDNSNTPAISGGFAKLVSTGDIIALASAIRDSAGTVLSEAWVSDDANGYRDYSKRVTKYASKFSKERTKSRYMGLIDRLAV